MKKISDIRYGSYERNLLDLYLPDSENFSVFIYFHGGGIEAGDKSDAERFAEYLSKRNIAVVSANYRLYPDAEYPDFIRDAAAAVSWTHKNINSYGYCEKFIIGGTSAGGYLSMMLCFDKTYLSAHGIDAEKIDGFFHDAGQPTTHFNVLKERGIDSRRVIINEAAPIYHIGLATSYPPMHFVVSDNDMLSRYEQTMLLLSTLRNFGYDSSKYDYSLMHGTHCHYFTQTDENGDNVLGTLIYDFIKKEIIK